MPAAPARGGHVCGAAARRVAGGGYGVRGRGGARGSRAGWDEGGAGLGLAAVQCSTPSAIWSLATNTAVQAAWSVSTTEYRSPSRAGGPP
ncbi:hypothetical protein ACFQX7_26575 [Luedemannella flava]